MKIVFFLFITFYLVQTKAQQITQIVKGNVSDEASKQSLQGVTIRLASNLSKTTLSDSSGNFKLTDIPLGRQRFIISAVGYEPLSLNNIIVTAGKEVDLTISLRESLMNLDVVEITANENSGGRKVNNDMLSVSARTFNMDETKRYAGSLGDPARMATNFAGVVSTNDTRNDIIIRGNSPNAMLWQLEGLNIPNPNHFGSLNSMGGSVSMLNSNLIDQSDFMTGAFPAQYGNALSGVFDLKLRNGNSEKHEFVTQMGFNGFEGGAEGPIGNSKGASYLINARYSTLSLFQNLGIEFGTGGATPEYMDLNYKINSRIGKHGNLSLFGIWGRSSMDILASEYDPEGQSYGNEYSNRYPRYQTSISGLSYKYQLSKKTAINFILGYSRTNEQFDRDSVNQENINQTIPDWHWRFKINKFSGVLHLHHKFNAKHSLVAGITEDFTNYTLFNRRIRHGISEMILNNRNGDFGLMQAFTQWKFRMTDHFSMVSGLHYQYLSLSQTNSLEPRIGVKYEGLGSHVFGFAYGLHSQMDNILTNATVTTTAAGNRYTNESLGFIRSHQFILSHDWNIRSNTHLKTELYFQRLFDVPVTKAPSSFSTLNLGAETIPVLRDNLINEGVGRNYGLDITLERLFNKGFYYLLTGSFFSSRYQGSDGIWRNTAFNMKNVFNLLGGKEWKVGKQENIFGLSVKVSRVGGRYLSPVDIASSVIDGEIQYEETRAYSLQQPAYFRADVKVSYRKEFTRATMELALDLQNVTDNKNIFRQEWNAQQLNVINVYQQGFFPVPFVRFTF
ncbi:MAG: TonB-dependent receptor [Olivibacter sp.]|nr:TonB-dependent receptor [Olivibacter sp. UJ_SKK_5.1]